MKAKLISLAFFASLVLGGAIVGNIETYYHSQMVVTETDSTSHTVTLTDRKGNRWSYYIDSSDVPPIVGTEMVCTMHTNHTNTFYDDRIISVKVK